MTTAQIFRELLKMATTTPANAKIYETILLQHKDHVHDIIQDMLNCKLDAIRKTSVHDIEPLINLFLSSTPHKKKEALIEFLRLMSEYRTTDQEVLYRRLKALKDDLRRTEGNSDLYFYALRKYGQASTSENEE